MPDNELKKRIVTVIASIVVVFATGLSCRQQEANRTGDTSSQGDSAAAEPHRRDARPTSDELERVLCTMRVNGLGLARLPKSTPIYFECVFANPMKDKQLVLPQAESVTVLLTDKAGEAASVRITPVGPAAANAAPWGSAMMVWRIEGKLSPGVYSVTARLPESFPSADAAGRSVRVRPARLIVTDQPEDAALSARARRRLKMLHGDAAGVLNDLTGALAKDPENRLAAMELISTLADQGKYAESRKVLLDYLHGLQSSAQADKKTFEIPCWAASELEFLTDKSRKAPAPNKR